MIGMERTALYRKLKSLKIDISELKNEIIVSSAEEVGFNIAKQLVDENNDVQL